MCGSFYHPLNYSNNMQQDSRLQSANTLDLLVAIFPRKVVSFSLSPLLYPLKDIHYNIFGGVILKSGCLFLSSILPVVCFMVLLPSVSVLFLQLRHAISITVCRSLSSSCLRARFSRYLQNNSTLFLHLYCHRNCEPSASVEVASHSIDGL